MPNQILIALVTILTLYVFGLVIRQSGDAGTIKKVQLITTGGTTTLWSGSDPTASDPTWAGLGELVFDFQEVADVIGVKITVDASAGTPQIDAVRLLTGGTATETTVGSWTYGADGSATFTSYDEDGLPAETTHYLDGVVIQGQVNTYFAGGELESRTVTDALGNVTYTEHDEDGYAIEQTVGLGSDAEATTLYDYDDDHRLISLIDPNGDETTWAYVGNTVTMTDPLGNEEVRTYDDDGKLLSILTRNDLLRTFEYDEEGRLITETWYDGPTDLDAVVETFTWDYNDQGLLAEAENGVGTYTFTYDSQGRIIQVDEPFDVTLSFGYDQYGYRNLVVDSFGNTERSIYNSSGQLLSRVLTVGGDVLRIDQTFDVYGRLETQSRYRDAAGTTLVASTTYAYRADGKLESIVHLDGDDVEIGSYEYSYDDVGQITSILDHGVLREFGYDETGQLTSEDATNYSYDANGNRDNYTYDTTYESQLESDGTYTYEHDDEGSITKKEEISSGETWTYAYDHANHLINAKLWDEDPELVTTETLLREVDYKYDVFARCVLRWS